MDTIKRALLEFCKAYAEERFTKINNSLIDIKESLTTETKSSAGDKHETGRAMLQLEREKLGERLAVAEKMHSALSRINMAAPAEHIRAGDLVFTSKNNYFLAISAGEFRHQDLRVYCISTQTPIGILLLGKSIGNTFEFNGEVIEIMNIQ